MRVQITFKHKNSQVNTARFESLHAKKGQFEKVLGEDATPRRGGRTALQVILGELGVKYFSSRPITRRPAAKSVKTYPRRCTGSA